MKVPAHIGDRWPFHATIARIQTLPLEQLESLAVLQQLNPFQLVLQDLG